VPPTTCRTPAGLGLVAAALLLVGVSCTSGDGNGSPETPGTTAVTGAEVSPTAPGAVVASCEEITRFADTTNFTGITYDYTPSASPAALAEQSELVVAGTTTGDVEIIRGESGGDLDVVVTVEVSEVLRSRLPDPIGPTVDVHVPASNDGFASRAARATVEGIPVVAFLTSGPRGLVPQVEGLVTACATGGLLGRVGTEGTWADVDSLDGLTARTTG
jgi:hypothetical protein